MALASGTRSFVYDADGRVLGEYGASAADVKAEFIWALPQAANDNTFGGDDGVGGYAPLAVATPDNSGTIQLNWVYGNHLGVPIVTTDATGALATTPNDYLAPGFPGQSRVIADVFYNRYRDYDPTTGRYIEADPIGLAGGSNPYLYAGANPLNFIDPSGRGAEALGCVVFGPVAPECVVVDLAGTAIGLYMLTHPPLPAPRVAPVPRSDPQDCCVPLYIEIKSYRDELAGRLVEYREDKLKLPQFGPFSRATHVEQFRGWQRGLQKLLVTADTKGCTDYVRDAWYYATVQIDRRF